MPCLHLNAMKIQLMLANTHADETIGGGTESHFVCFVFFFLFYKRFTTMNRTDWLIERAREREIVDNKDEHNMNERKSQQAVK